MTMTRRALLTAAAAAALARPAVAQAPWPNRRVRIIVPFPPGGGTDVLARLIAQHLQLRLGQPFIVENRAGGSGVLGTEQVARAAPDGYTLAVNSSGPITIFPQLTSVPYDPMRSFAPVALPAVTPLVLVVPPNSPSRGFVDLVARARQEAGRLPHLHIGVGSPSQLVAEMFARAFQLDMTQCRSACGPADRCDGRSLHYLLFTQRRRRCRWCARPAARAGVTSVRRLAELPDVPTMIENSAPGFEASAWSAMFAPAGTGRDRHRAEPGVSRLHGDA